MDNGINSPQGDPTQNNPDVMPINNAVSERPQETGSIVAIKHGHKFIFGCVGLLVLVVIVAGVYVWQHKKVSSLQNQVTSLQKQVNNLSNQVKNGQSSASSSTSIYSGWLSYCSTLGGMCLKYPSTWTISSNGSNIIPQEYIVSQSKLVDITYNPAGGPSSTGGPATVNVVSVNSAATKDLEVVGLVQTVTGNKGAASTYYAFLSVISSSSKEGTSSNLYSAGSSYTNSDEPGQYLFYNKNLPKYSQSIQVSDSLTTGSVAFQSLQAAEAWFKTTDVVTATQILESLNYK